MASIGTGYGEIWRKGEGEGVVVDGSIQEGEARARLVSFPPSQRLLSPPASFHFSILAKERTEVQENGLSLGLGRLHEIDPKICRTGERFRRQDEGMAGEGLLKKKTCFL